MNTLEYYLEEVLGLDASVQTLQENTQGALPLYIREGLQLYSLRIAGNHMILVQPREAVPNTAQVVKYLDTIGQVYHQPVALLAEQLDGLQRKRLIEQQVDFIVPGKQLYLPHLLMDLREVLHRRSRPRQTFKLLPSAQCMLLYHLRQKKELRPLGDLSFKELAHLFHYTPTAITKAADNLVQADLCAITGTKEKYLRFKGERQELWVNARSYLVSPVLKRVFVDRKPDLFMLPSNLSALPAYSDLNSSRQRYYAMERTHYFSMRKDRSLINENEQEGAICLEIWKYDPIIVANAMTVGEDVVDPLSLYLSLKDADDERIDIALEQLLEKYTVW